MKKTGNEVKTSAEAGVPAAEAALLFAIACSPSLLIPFGENPFEPHKAALLWTASIIGAAAVLPVIVRLTSSLTDRPWTRWLVAAVLCSAVATIASVSLSPSPSLAWWGSGLRRYGAFTELALLSVTIIVAAVAVDRTRLERVVMVVVLGSVGPTMYALSQWLGVDPLEPDRVMWDRPGSTFGNPLWLSGYLAAVMPMTIAHAVLADRPLQRGGAWGLAVLQSIVLLATRSRGPVLAMGVAATVMAAALLSGRGYRRLAAVIGLATAVTAATAVVIVPRWLGHVTTEIAERRNVDDRSQATISVRAQLWRAAGFGIAGGPLGLTVGSGPESMTRVLTRYSHASLRLLEGPEDAPDRAHNDTLDSAVMFGAIGLALRLLMLYIALGAAFAALGLLPRSDTVRFAVLTIVVVVTMAVAGCLLDGRWTLAVSVPAALPIVASLWIVWRGGNIAHAHGRVVVLVVAATASWVVHYVDVQTSIASVASAVVGTVALAVTVACAARTAASPAVPHSQRRSNPQRVNDGMAVVAGLLPVLMLIALTTPATGTSASAWRLTAITWIVANLVIGVRLRAMAINAAVLVTAALVWLPVSAGSAAPAVQGPALADRVVTIYFMLAAGFVFVTSTLAAPPLRAREALIDSVAVAIAALVVGRAAVHRSAADVLMGAGRACEQQRDLVCADDLYTDANRLDGSDARGFTRLARVRIDEADSPAGAERRDALFRDAATQLALASAADPFDYHRARNRGSLERRWARRLAPPDRAQHLEDADGWYASATSLAPSAPQLWAEWANLKLERGLTDEALPMLERSVALSATSEACDLCDVLVRAIGIEVAESGGLARAAVALEQRGYPRLAERYTARARALSTSSPHP